MLIRKSFLPITGAIAVALAAFLSCGNAAELTAFQLVKEGDKFLGEQSKGRMVQARSEKSIAGLVPNVCT